MPPEKILLQQEKQNLLEQGGTMEDVLEHLKKEKELEQRLGHPTSSQTERRDPSRLEENMHFAERCSENLLKHYQALLKNESRTQDPESRAALSQEKFSILSEFNNLAAHVLYTEMKGFSSSNPETERLLSEIRDIYDGELTQINENAGADADPAILALIRTRSAEIERMKIELDIRWIEKKMWDLHVEWSPEKEALAKELQAIKTERLNTATAEYLSALLDERDALLKSGGTRERSMRLSYVNARLIELGGKT